MADQKRPAPENHAPAQEAAAKRKLPIKTLAVIAVVLVVEALAISGAFMLNGGPAAAQADETDAALTAQAASEQPVELLVLSGRFLNGRTGRSYLYDTDVYIVVRQRDKELVEGRIEAMRAQITTDVAAIYRRADPNYFTEFELATITRQVRAALDERIGRPPGAAADGSYIQRLLIPKSTPLRVDL